MTSDPIKSDADLSADLVKGAADRLTDAPDNAQAALADAMHSDPDLGRKGGVRRWWATVWRKRF